MMKLWNVWHGKRSYGIYIYIKTCKEFDYYVCDHYKNGFDIFRHVKLFAQCTLIKIWIAYIHTQEIGCKYLCNCFLEKLMAFIKQEKCNRERQYFNFDDEKLLWR